MADEPLSFLARLKQHHLYGVVVAYAVVAGFLIQLVSRAFPYFGWTAAVPAIIIVLLLGFPVVVVLAWLFIKPKDTAKSSTWQRRHWKLSAVGTVVVIVLVVISGVYGVRFSERRAERLTTLSTVRSQTAATTSSAAPSAVTVIPAKSIAVLPLVNESGDKDQQYFSDGLSEDLITTLSQFAGLKVISRDSSFRFRNSGDSSQVIGEKLGVAHLLEGSVQRLGDEVRISAELVNAADGSTLWSRHYDRPYKDLFALQDDITTSVTNALKAKLLDANYGAVPQSDRPPSGSLVAYNAYLQGQFYYQRGDEADLREALAQFAEAVRLDPDYAAAYAQASQVWVFLAGYYFDLVDKPHAYAEARAAADMALHLDPDLVVAHLEKGAVLVNVDFDWGGARAEYQHAIKLAPGNADAYFSLSTSAAEFGHPKSAVTLARRALAGNPLSAFWHDWLASYLGALGRFDEAEAAARHSVELEPQQPLSYRELTYIEVLKGDATAALAAAQSTPAGRNRDIAMAWALQIGPDHAAADAALQELITKHAGDSSYQIAEVYALRRDPDNVFKWLDQAWANRDNGIQYLLYDPLILRYQHDPRFAAFCKKVGLPTTTDAKAMP
ncbi:MAG: hypothetical protein WBR15_05065 [Gammaproteobacteria bacterium]